MAKGRKTGGRTKGTPNRVTTETKEVFRLILQDMAPEAKEWIRECAQGVEIEKTLESGEVVLGRFGADPGKAVDLLLKMSEFYFPKIARMEKGIADASDDELLAEIRRRREAAEKAKAPA